jgi:hypothetical protein
VPDLPGGVTPFPYLRKFLLIQRFTAGHDLQNRHKKGVIAKIVFLNDLVPEVGYLSSPELLFFDLYIPSIAV